MQKRLSSSDAKTTSLRDQCCSQKISRKRIRAALLEQTKSILNRGGRGKTVNSAVGNYTIATSQKLWRARRGYQGGSATKRQAASPRHSQTTTSWATLLDANLRIQSKISTTSRSSRITVMRKCLATSQRKRSLRWPHKKP